MTRSVELRRGGYLDSVTLMQVSSRVATREGVRAALVAMATDLNLELAGDMGFDLPAGAGPHDLLVALDADSAQALDLARADVDSALEAASSPARSGTGPSVRPPPVTVAAAARLVERPAVALVSTPGPHAFVDAVDAVDAGLTTMVFSDNVPVEQEVALKQYADRAGVLVMGPDCGTAVLGGVGLGFANVVRPGPVGIVAASGTGAQQLMSLLDAADVGVAHCVGVGGRDLSAAVGGRSTLRALDLLDADPATELVVVVSKPPAPEVAELVRSRAARARTPVHLALLGPGRPTLTDAARDAVRTLGGAWPEPQRWVGAVDEARGGGALRGLFSGGTLCDEAMLVAAERLGRVRSNIPLEPAWAVGDDLASDGHTMLDFGDDRLTLGRPHPMIDGALRIARMRAELEDPGCGVLLLDVVLGLGADADPASGLVPVVQQATAARVPVVVSLVGTRDDPQGLRGQAGLLAEAGAHVLVSNAEAAGFAVDLVAGRP